MNSCTKFLIIFLSYWLKDDMNANALPHSNSSQQKDCNEKSKLWQKQKSDELNSKCNPLHYNKQYCAVNTTTQFDCMVERAVMHDENSCLCHKAWTKFPTHSCVYVEICAFVDPTFNCTPDYQCNVTADNSVSCIAPGRQPYKNNCMRGLIFCHDDELCHPVDFSFNFMKLLEYDCKPEYLKTFGSGKTVYFVDQVHFNDSSLGYSKVSAIMLAPGDEDNPCVRHSIYDFPESLDKAGDDWIVKLVASASVLVVILVAICIWMVRNKNNSINRRWKAAMNDIADFLRGSVRIGDDGYRRSANPVSEDVDPMPIAFYKEIDDKESTSSTEVVEVEEKIIEPAGSELPEDDVGNPNIGSEDMKQGYCTKDDSAFGRCFTKDLWKERTNSQTDGKVFENSSYSLTPEFDVGYLKKCDPSLVTAQ